MTTPRSTVIPEANMQSPTMQEWPCSHTPEIDLNPIVKVSQQDRPVDSWTGICRFLKHEENDPAGYFFDFEPIREGSD